MARAAETYVRCGFLKRAAALCTFGAALVLSQLLAQPTGQAQAPDALPFSKSYSITGNYVVGGVDLAPRSAVNGFVTDTIVMNGVPADAEIVAAFLYWETIANQTAQTHGALFRGSPMTAWKATSRPLTPDTASCWSGGAGSNPVTRITAFRADVLRLLPLETDANGNSTGRRLVNDSDLNKHGLPRHTVTLPEAGTGSAGPSSAGASLFVIYRDPAEPLRKIVLSDGLYIRPPGATMTQTIRGFFQSSTARDAGMTHILSSGRNSTRRTWSTQTFNASSLLPGTDFNDGYGETVTTTVDSNDNDCRSLAAIVFSVRVQDSDGDGLIDKLEDDVSGLKEPNGEPLPDLRAMGASSQRKNVFIEIGSLKADPGTPYGSADAPFSATVNQVVDNAGHSHLPGPAVLKMVGEKLCSG